MTVLLIPMRSFAALLQRPHPGVLALREEGHNGRLQADCNLVQRQGNYGQIGDFLPCVVSTRFKLPGGGSVSHLLDHLRPLREGRLGSKFSNSSACIRLIALLYGLYA